MFLKNIVSAILDVLGKNMGSAMLRDEGVSNFFMFLMILVESPVELGKIQFSYGIIECWSKIMGSFGHPNLILEIN